MAKIIEYKIIEKNDPQLLSKEVNAAINEGWQPLGAPHIEYTPDPYDSWNYSQPMVKYEQSPAAKLQPITKTKGLGGDLPQRPEPNPPTRIPKSL